MKEKRSSWSQSECSVKIKAVLFDLHGTLAYVKNAITETEISGHL